MKEVFVGKTVSMPVEQIQWLTEKYGNVTKGIQAIIKQKMEDDENGNARTRN